MDKFNYLTEEEAKMPTELALLQLMLGIQTCKNKSDVLDLLWDAFTLGKEIGFIKNKCDKK